MCASRRCAGDGAKHVWKRANRKSGASPTYFLPPAVIDALDASFADRGPVTGYAPLFATATGRPLDQAAIYRLLQRVARAAGIPKASQLSPHSIRRSMATLALNEGPAVAPVAGARLRLASVSTGRLGARPAGPGPCWRAGWCG